MRLEPPRVGVLSLHQFVNHGGAEFVVFRATPPDVTAGVRVGDVDYPAFPGSSVGISDPAVRVAFFVLGYDQDLQRADQRVRARSPPATRRRARSNAAVSRSRSPSRASRSTIDFLQRVVPAIAQNTPGAGIDTNDLLKGFLKINAICGGRTTRRSRSWRRSRSRRCCGARRSRSCGNTAVESRFADYRTYFYKGKEIDQQVHLGFDLASLQQAPVPASNRGVVDLRELPRHLRQLRRDRSRPRRAVALCPHLDDRT